MPILVFIFQNDFNGLVNRRAAFETIAVGYLKLFTAPRTADISVFNELKQIIPVFNVSLSHTAVGWCKFQRFFIAVECLWNFTEYLQKYSPEIPGLVLTALIAYLLIDIKG